MSGRNGSPASEAHLNAVEDNQSDHTKSRPAECAVRAFVKRKTWKTRRWREIRSVTSHEKPNGRVRRLIRALCEHYRFSAEMGSPARDAEDAAILTSRRWIASEVKGKQDLRLGATSWCSQRSRMSSASVT